MKVPFIRAAMISLAASLPLSCSGPNESHTLQVPATGARSFINLSTQCQPQYPGSDWFWLCSFPQAKIPAQKVSETSNAFIKSLPLVASLEFRFYCDSQPVRNATVSIGDQAVTVQAMKDALYHRVEKVLSFATVADAAFDVSIAADVETTFHRECSLDALDSITLLAGVDSLALYAKAQVTFDSVLASVYAKVVDNADELKVKTALSDGLDLLGVIEPLFDDMTRDQASHVKAELAAAQTLINTTCSATSTDCVRAVDSAKRLIESVHIARKAELGEIIQFINSEIDRLGGVSAALEGKSRDSVMAQTKAFTDLRNTNGLH